MCQGSEAQHGKRGAAWQTRLACEQLPICTPQQACPIQGGMCQAVRPQGTTPVTGLPMCQPCHVR